MILSSLVFSNAGALAGLGLAANLTLSPLPRGGRQCRRRPGAAASRKVTSARIPP